MKWSYQKVSIRGLQGDYFYPFGGALLEIVFEKSKIDLI